MTEQKFWVALNMALREEMAADRSVVVIGEDVGIPGGPFGVTRGLLDEFGPMRVRNAPIAESAIVGAGIGAALTGLRPVVEIMFMDFLTLCADQLVNQAAKIRYFSAGTLSVPITIRTVCGNGGGMGAQHSQSLESWFCHIPGLAVVVPSTPASATGLLKAAIRCDEPVLFVEDASLYRIKGMVDSSPQVPAIGRAEVVRAGSDLTIVSYGRPMHLAQNAAAILEEQGHDPEVIDLRTVQPWDRDVILSSAARTGRFLVVHDAAKSFGVGAELSATVSEEIGPKLRAVPRRLGAGDTPASVLPEAENARLPTTERIVAVAEELYAQQG
jgi:pyruvate/2-oxoglutarate/acetoin dehydrogenase E1 component